MTLPHYAELHCISNFSFLRGASFPEELIEQAAALGYRAIAITDECSVAGVVRAHQAVAGELGKQGGGNSGGPGIKLIIGSEFVLDDGLRLVLLACNRRGYGQLCHLITLARRQAKKGEYSLDREMISGLFQTATAPEDCLALWLPGPCWQQDSQNQLEQITWVSRIFPGRSWIGVELLLQGDDREKLAWLQKAGRQLSLPLCACGGVTMHRPERRALRDTVTAIRLGRTLTELGFAIPPNAQDHLRPVEQLNKLYPRPLLEESLRIAERCDFSLEELRYEYPHELVPAGYTAHDWLRELTEQGMKQRWPGRIDARIRDLVDHELELVRELGYEHFFLTVHDLVQFARSQHILCQGRGSAANSIICYCLGITAVDPARMELLFERFLSKERNEPPDIDVDFEHERREEIIQYIYRKYGRHRAALAATVICYRGRSAIRDVSKVLGISPELSDHLARSIHWGDDDIQQQLSDSGIDFEQPLIKRLVYLVRALIGFPRHLSQHVGGFVISQGPLSELVPVENAAMPDRTIIQWEKDDLEALGLLKVDVLALGMLTAVRKALDLVNSYTDRQLAIDNIPAEDSAVYDMLGRADSIGVFQVESRAQMSMLPRLRPRNYYDLVIQIAIVRPGPIQGDMVHPFLARRSGREKVTYPGEEIRSVLERTEGVPIFQEQVMKIAMVAAGFTAGQADQLRRAMAAWKRKGGLEPFREQLIQGMISRNYTEEFALQIYNQIKGFGDYGFPESHSASFALLVYVSSWLKCHYPAAFTCALLNSQPMGFYAPSQLVQDLQRHDVKVLPVDVNRSEMNCSLEFINDRYQSPALRLGLSMAKGLSLKGAESLQQARRERTFKNITDLIRRTGLNKRDLECLAAADALKNISGDRHRAFWQVSGEIEPTPLFVTKDSVSGGSASGNAKADSSIDDNFGIDILLPPPSEAQNILADYNSIGLTLRRHPLALLRNHLDRHHVTTATALWDMPEVNNQKCYAKVAGIVTCRQRPGTASGVIFVTLEDESGFINVVVWPGITEKRKNVVYQSSLMGVIGEVQKSEGTLHLIATDLVDLSPWLNEMNIRSRDFS